MKNYDYIILGGDGFLGSEIVNYLLNKKKNVLSINSKNYKFLKGSTTKILINANGNTFRFKANKNPSWDFKKSFLSVTKSINDFRFEKYIYISSVDVYDNKNNSNKNSENSFINPSNLDYYAYHKWLSERYIEKYTSSYLIFRLGTLIGPNMKKGPFYDILNNKSLFMSLNSKLTLISKKNAVRLIFKIMNLKKSNEIFNITSLDSFKLINLKDKFGELKIKDNKEYNYNINVNKIKKYCKVPNSTEEIEFLLKI